MSFQKAIQNIPAISKCYQNGLQALGNHSSMIVPSDPRNCNGSVDLDQCLANTFPNEARWDYAVGYNNRCYFIEVHPASGQVSQIIAKVTWLRNWLKVEGALLLAIHNDDQSFHWIPTSGVNIPQRYKAQLAQNKIIVKSSLTLT